MCGGGRKVGEEVCEGKGNAGKVLGRRRIEIIGEDEIREGRCEGDGQVTRCRKKGL